MTASQPMKRPVPAEKVGPVRRPANGRPAGEKAGWSVGHGDSRRAQGVTLVVRRRAGAEAGVSGGVSRARGREVSDAGSSGRHVGVVAQRLAGGDEWCSRDDQGDGSVGAWQRWQRWQRWRRRSRTEQPRGRPGGQGTPNHRQTKHQKTLF